MDLYQKYTPTRMGDHDFITMEMADFLALAPIPTNRDSRRRVPAMRKTFEDAVVNGDVGTMSMVAIARVDHNFTDIESGYQYQTGDWYLVDGNTRQHWLNQNPEIQAYFKNGITAKIHHLTSFKSVEQAYYPYNNAKSVEKTSQLLQGLIFRFQWRPYQNLFAAGQFVTALDWSHTPPGEKFDLGLAMYEMLDAAKEVDGIRQDGFGIGMPKHKKLKSQAIIAAALYMAKLHPNNLRLHNFINRLSTMSVDDVNGILIKPRINPIEIVALEYGGASILRPGSNGHSWLNGLAGQTKFASKEAQMDFLVHWMSTYINDDKVDFDIHRGVKRAHWEGSWSDVTE